MGKIAQLPEDIAIKIAAGEVVERPASVVKELVENAIDAGATEVEITINEGGKRLIEIKDNGIGMERDDAERAFLRHGTSKIRHAEDLAHITTLGFRGEALAAIAASAEGLLITCETDAREGTEIAFRYGDLISPKPHAPRIGTTIRVENLFASLPARQKFLKADATEWKACLDVITKQTIAHPQIAFLVKHNDRMVFDLSKDQNFTDRISQLWGISSEKLIEVNSEIPHMSLTGILVKPEVAHMGKGKQFFAVNGHPVNDKMVVRAIRDAYGTLLPPAIYPSFALNLAIHPGVVDINIHPRKDEVRFINPQEIYRFVMQSVSQSLQKVDLAFTEAPIFSLPPQRTLPPPSPTNQGLPAKAAEPSMARPSFVSRNATFNHVPLAPIHPPAPTEESNENPPEIILTIDNTYLVTKFNNTLLLIDQHAAHERILYNQLWEQEQSKQTIKQSLLIPAHMELNEQQQALLDEHQSDFELLGFEFENDFITAIPQLGKTHGPVSLFTNILSGLNEDRQEPELKDFHHKLFATMACKAAIKAGDQVSEAEKQKLVRDLMSLEDRFTCPHGRPSHILISSTELEKLFKRTGF